MIIHKTATPVEIINKPTKLKTNLIIEFEYAEEVAILYALIGKISGKGCSSIIHRFPTKMNKSQSVDFSCDFSYDLHAALLNALDDKWTDTTTLPNVHIEVK